MVFCPFIPVDNIFSNARNGGRVDPPRELAARVADNELLRSGLFIKEEAQENKGGGS